MDAATDKSRLVDIQELRAYSGLSIATIHRLKDKGRIPFFQPAGKGGKLLFPLDAIERAATAINSDGPADAPTGGLSSGQLSGPRPNWMQQVSPEIQDT